MTRDWCVLAACLLLAAEARADEGTMVRLEGTPAEIGRTWGTVNKRTITRDLEAHYLKTAAKKGISEAILLERAKPFTRIVEQISPHWLEEAKAVAQAAGVREDLYLSFVANRSRNLFLHECTSYSVSREHTRDNVIMFHKNRDNVDREQAAYVLESHVKGIHKFIAICDTSVIECSMMVNDKGLAGSADYPANLTRKDDPSALLPDAAEPNYRGLMNGAILRYIAERASTAQDALRILEDFVKKGHYAGGEVNGTHWLFVDRNGVILEVSNNARHVVSRLHTEKVYFSRLDDCPAARRLRDADGPIDFPLFHSISRDPSICLRAPASRSPSVSGMTVEIDAAHPERLTCAWISLPAHAVSFPLLMAQTAVPACLINGEAYALGGKTHDKTRPWEAIEGAVHQSKELVKAKLVAGSMNQAAAIAEQWSQKQAEMLREVLQTP
ncbi:MAG: hypothetical protein ABFD16_31260 [Thermoguttaceae bacterium]